MCFSKQAHSHCVQVGAMHAIHIWMYSLGISKISNADMLTSPLMELGSHWTDFDEI
jgi:hypothetical protein